MAGDRDRPPALVREGAHRPIPPRPTVAVVVGGISVVVIVVSSWLATRPSAEQAQTSLVQWFNQPPQPVAAVFAIVNPVLRPVPLVVLVAVLILWILRSAAGRSERIEIARALVVALSLGEVLAEGLKRLADQPRPLAVVPGLDSHGYPITPHGNAYPSAHTALVVAAVSAVWPWMGWPQRVVGVTFAVLVGTNRVYIGAHWPIDVIGGVAIGLLSSTVAWLIAARWPVPKTSTPGRVG